MRGRTQVDVVIVGAGAAGLAAALTARDLGIDAIVLEAMDRAGGRAYTRHEPFGFAWDAGCHWLHSASINPFTRFADQEGIRYSTQPTPWHSWLDSKEVSAQDEDAIDGYIDDGLARAIDLGQQGHDLPLSECVDVDSPWFPVFQYQINAEWGVNPEAASTLDLARYRDLDENWPVIDGYGALVQRVAASVVGDVQLNTPVTAIAATKTGVRVSTPDGTFAAGAAIVTASTNVLADEVITFEPELPLWQREAIAALPLGYADKIALQFPESILADVAESNAAIHIGDEQMIGFRFRPYGRNLVDCYVAGPAAADLEAAGVETMNDVAVEAASRILGTSIKGKVLATAISRWGREPFIRGAYAAAVPGMADRRPDLVRPIADRIFFAGEATSSDFFTTCHGAWESGVKAMRAAAVATGIKA